MSDRNVPFGLRFAETPRRETGLELTEPFYDHEAGLSFIIEENGDRRPFVLWAWQFAGDTQTGTTTRKQGDTEDSDEIRGPRTQTVTETRENTDSDYH